MRKLEVHLADSRKWSVRDGATATGHAFQDGEILEADALATLVSQVGDGERFSTIVSGLNGFFALITRSASCLLAAVDHVRSIPLFYANVGGRFYISDDARWVEAQIGNADRDPLAKAEFLLTGYVTGSNTLNPHVKQLQAGELLIATESDAGPSVTTWRYYEFQRTEEAEGSPIRLRHQLETTFDRSIDRLLKFANGRQLVIPLSGGYDSRLIAALVKRSSHQRVLTYTYGRERSTEVRVSKGVADALGFGWAFVPYGPAEWRGWFATEVRAEYFGMAHGLSSVPHIQDWPAVWSLRKQGLLDDDAIFVPGHTGDFVSGGHTLAGFEPQEVYSPEEYVMAVIDTHHWLWRVGDVLQAPDALHERIWQRSTSEDRRHLTGLEAVALHDRWDWQERQAKFIVNSVRVYDFWGYDWWMPLWDMEFVRFWHSVPFEFRQGRRLYIDYVTDLYSDVAGVDPTEARRTDMDSLPARMVTRIKNSPLLPRNLVKRLWNRTSLTSPYRNHPMAWFALVPEDRFKEIYDGNQSINSLLAAYLVYGSWQGPERPA